MISIITCARTKNLPEAFVKNLTTTIGVPFEIIIIDNSENKYSIFTAYNEGYAKSKYPYLCFVHDDVLFHTPNWGTLLIAHLQEKQTGIVGLAGGDILIRVPSSWSSGQVHINIIQSDKTGRKPTKLFRLPEKYPHPKRSTVVLDGVMLAMRRELMQQIHFDENLKGFHGYDFDITIQSTLAGFTNYVAYDISLEHLSRGKPDKNYFKNLIIIFKKWEAQLPLIGLNISEEKKNKIPKFEKKRLKVLINRMIKTGFETKEILNETNYYRQLIGKTETRDIQAFLYFNIFFTRLFTRPKHFFKK